MNRRFVLVDRDGTIIEECEYLSDPERVKLIPGAAAALRALRRVGLGLVMITNQSGIGRALFDERQLGLVHYRLLELLEREAIQFDGIYICPHAPDDDCACRKPKAALAERASVELGFDLKTSFVIGDKSSDMEMGRAIGATTLLVETGYGLRHAGRAPADYVARDLEEAAGIIQRLLSGGGRPVS